MYQVGIDLGTTNSVVSVFKNGKRQTIKIDGKASMPSVVYWKSNEEIEVGFNAKRRMLLYPNLTVSSVKRFMGDSKKEFQIHDNIYTPVDISSHILKKLIDCASKELGEKVTDAVVTVPAYFDANQREDTKKAAIKAGINLIKLESEPTAAAVAYGVDKKKDQVIAVYDLGGGTFDISILEVDGNNFTVKGVGGDSFLGGDNFDEAVKNYLTQEICKVYKDFQPDRKADKKLKELAERAKVDLSDFKVVEVDIIELMGQVNMSIELSRVKFNELIKSDIDKTIVLLKEAFKKANYESDDIDRVILVGGSTKIPYVQEIVTQEIKEPFVADNVDEVVAQGAAIIAKSVPSDIIDDDNTPAIVVNNIAVHNLGVRVSVNNNIDIFSTLIKGTDTLPVKCKKSYTTSRDNQTVVPISVFQGDNNCCSENTFIGGFQLEGVPLAKAGSPNIEVEFKLDESDLLEVSAVCDGNMVTKKLNIKYVEEDDFVTELPKAIMLIIDRSWSMEDSNSLQIAKQAVIQYLKEKERLNSQDKIGCIAFGSEVELICEPLTDYDLVIEKVKCIEIEGLTNMADALIESRLELALFKEKYQLQTILLTDGYPNDSGLVKEQVEEYKSNNIICNTVGVGEGYDRSLLEELAHKTGGIFKPADNIHDLISVFVSLAEKN